MSVAVVAPQRPMEIVGHRGSSARAPENSLAAIQHAFDVHADGVEFDLQRTKDGVVIVLHDSSLQRTAASWTQRTGPAADEYARMLARDVSEVEFEQIRNVDIGAWKGPEWAGETLCTFEQALRVVSAHPGKRCYPEIKAGGEDILTAAKRAVEAVGLGPNCLSWISFDKNTMRAAKRAMPAYPALWVIEPKSTEEGLACVHEAKEARLDGVDIIADPAVVTADLVVAAQALDLKVGVWVTSKLPHSDTLPTWQQMRDLGVDFFTSDLPEPIHSWPCMPGCPATVTTAQPPAPAPACTPTAPEPSDY